MSLRSHNLLKLLNLLLATLLATALTGCFNFHSAGEIASRIVSEPVEYTEDTNPNTDPITGNPDEEGRYQQYAELANARAAYTLGWQGQKVTVGVVDSGFNFGSNSLKDNLLDTGKKAAADGTLSDPDTTDPASATFQGNAAAAVLAGANTDSDTGGVNYHGVAPLAKILPLQAGSQSSGVYAGLTGDQNSLVEYALTLNSGAPGVQILNFSAYEDGGTAAATPSGGVRSVQTAPAVITVRHNGNDVLWQVARTKQYYDLELVPGSEATAANDQANTLAALVDASDDVVFVYPTGKHSFNGANCIMAGGSCLQEGGSNVTWDDFKDSIIRDADGKNITKVEDLFPNGPNGPSGVGPNLPFFDTKFAGKVLAVASAVRDDDLDDAHGKNILGFANGCGVAKNWCLVAPDFNVISPVSAGSPDTGFVSPDNTAEGSSAEAARSNTSLATAVASGALAVLRSSNQGVPMSVLMAVLLSTADKTITDITGATTLTTFTGVDDVYGHGYLNLGAAITSVASIDFTPPSIAIDRYLPETNPNSANTNDDDRYQLFSRLVNARPAYSLGWQGQGVTVGVVDSGFEFDSNVLKDNLLGTGRRADADGNLSNPETYDPSFSHQGNAAAAVVAGANTAADTGGVNYHGVAPLAKILPLQAGIEVGGIYRGISGDQSALVGYALTLNSGDPGVQILNFSAYGDGGPEVAQAGSRRSVHTVPATITVRHNGNDVLWQVARTKQYYDLVEGTEATDAAGEASALAALVDADDDVVFVYPTGKQHFNGAGCIRVGGSCLQDSNSNDVTWDDFKESFIRDADNLFNISKVEALFPNGGNGPSGFGPNLPFYDSKFTGKVLAVASAVRDDDLDNGHGKNILGFANGCGVARNWCLVAPGLNLISPLTGGSPDTGFVGPDNTATGSSAEPPRSNTSLATAVASGALAVLRSANQSTPMSVLMAVLLTSADKTITSESGATVTTFTGVDDVYGHGYLNLGAAITSVSNIDIDLSGPTITIDRYVPATNPGSGNTGGSSRYQQFAGLANARPAYSMGWQGQRVTVGMIDSGFNFASNSIKDNLLDTGSSITGKKADADGNLSDPDRTDPATLYQGSAAAAVLAGANTPDATDRLNYHGVAPLSKILPLQAGGSSGGAYTGLTGDQSALVEYALTVNSGDPGVQVLNFSAYQDGGPAAGSSGSVSGLTSHSTRSLQTAPAVITVRHNGNDVLWQVARTKQYYDLVLGSEATAATNEASALAALVDNSDDVVFVYPTGKHYFNGAGCIRVGGSCLREGGSNVTWDDFKGSFTRKADGTEDVFQVEDLFPNGPSGPSGFGPNLPFYDSKFVGKVLAVASAVRDDNLANGHGKNILSYANGCGVAKNWCLIAPDFNQISTSAGGANAADTSFFGPDNTVAGSSDDAARSNTSLATAVASGALAVLRSANQSMPMSVLMAVLLTSADKTITSESGATVTTFTGVDDVYGHGYLNLGAAITSVANINIDLAPPSIVIERYSPKTNPNSANANDDDRYQLFTRLVDGRPAYSAGWQGQRVTIGVIDSGFNFGSNSIKDNLLGTGRKAAADGSLSAPDQTDPASATFQGNAAAAVLAGSNTDSDTGGLHYHGVAPQAKILPLQAGSQSSGVYAGLTGDQSALVGYALTVNSGDPGVQILNFSAYGDGGPAAATPSGGVRSVHTNPATITVRHNGNDVLWQVARTKQYYDLELVPSSEAAAAASEASALAALVDADDDVVFVYPTGKHSFNGAGCVRVGGSCLEDGGGSDVTWNDFKDSIIRDADGINVTKVETLFPNGMNGPSGFGPNLPFYDDKFVGKVLAVASAVRDDDLSGAHGKNILGFANGCGVAKNWCLVAPGLNRISPLTGSNSLDTGFVGPDNTATGSSAEAVRSNTSLATAVASGALAVLRSSNRSTPMSVLMAVLLSTADKTIANVAGEPVTTFTGVDDVYGHGYLNLGAAITAATNISIDLSAPSIAIDRYLPETNPNSANTGSADRYQLFSRLVNARPAYSLGWQGQGVTVGVVDSGFNFSSNVLMGNLLTTGKKAAADGTLSDPDQGDPSFFRQGSAAAAVLAGANTAADTGVVNYHGVAPLAKILPLQAGDEDSNLGGQYTGITGDQSALVGYALTLNSGAPGVQILNFSAYGDGGAAAATPSFSRRSVHTVPATITVRHKGNDVLWQVARTKQYYDLVRGSEAEAATSAATALAALVDTDDDVVFVYPTGKHSFNGAGCVRVGGSCLGEGGANVTWDDFKDSIVRDANGINITKVETLFPNGGNGPTGFGPNLPFYDSKFIGKVLAVASAVRDDDLSDGHGKNILGFANGCGVARNWCLVAPGLNLISPLTGSNSLDTGFVGPGNNALGSETRWASRSNTSLATAVASGALAVLRSANQSTPMSVLMAVLLTSADKTITNANGMTVTTFTGVDDVYGHGYLNLGAAITSVSNIDIDLSGPTITIDRYNPETNPNSANTDDDDRYQQFPRLVNARPAYSDGWQGQGVTIGVVDSGFNFSSNVLMGNLLTTGKKAAADGTLSDPDTTDPASATFQGSAAAAVLAGANTDSDTGGVNYHGVAPQAKILPLQAGSQSSSVYAGLTGDQSALVGYALTVNSGAPGVQILNFSAYGDGGSAAAPPSGGVRSVQTAPAVITVRHNGNDVLWQVARTKQYYDLVGGSEAVTAASEANALAALVDASDDVVFVYPTGKHSFNGAGCIIVGGSCLRDSNSNDVTWDDFKGSFTRKADGTEDVFQVEDLFPNGPNGSSGFGPNLPFYDSKFVGKVLAVASAVRDPNLSNGHGKNILSYANGCGAAKNWCLVAPDLNQISPLSGGSPDAGFVAPDNTASGSSAQASRSNTSLATAVASGALAVLRSANQSMPMSVLMAVLLTTADKTITDSSGAQVTTFTGVDDVYGHGYLNLGAAITSVANINIDLAPPSIVIERYSPKTNPNSANADDDDRYQQFARLVSGRPAYLLGAQGQRVTVGVVDSGFNFGSNSIKDNLLGTGRKAAADGSLSAPDQTDPASATFQGNAAAAVLAGANTDSDTGGVNYHGVAPLAKILPLQAGSVSGGAYAGLTGDQSALVGYALTVNSGDPGVQILNFSAYEDGGSAVDVDAGRRSVHTAPAVITVRHGGADRLWQVARTKQYYDLELVPSSEASAAASEASALAALVDADDDVVFVYPTGKHSFNGAGCIMVGGSCLQDSNSNDVTWDDFKDSIIRDADGTDVTKVETLFPNGPNGPSGFGPNLPFYDDKFVGKVLAVASAVRDDDLDDGHGKEINGFANGCGVAKNWCLVAPGLNRISPVSGGSPDTGFVGPDNTATGSSTEAARSNTSLATAVASGALAALRSTNRSTPMSVLMAVLLSTADKTITGESGADVTTFTGVDDVYGHGYLNLGAAITVATNISIDLSAPSIAIDRYLPETNPNSANTNDDDRYQLFSRLVNARPAYSLGWQGQGVTVGVIDSGFQFDSNVLKDNLLGTGRRADADGNLSNPETYDPSFSHQGNAAAAVVAGANTAADTGGVNYHGVAPLAKILPLQAGIEVGGVYRGISGDQSALVGYALTLNSGDPGVQILNFSAYGDGGPEVAQAGSRRSVHTVPATITVRHNGADILWQVARTKQYYDLVRGSEAEAATNEASALAALVDAGDDVVFVYPTGKSNFNGAGCVRVGGGCLQESNSDVAWNDFKGSFIRDADGINISKVEDLFPNGMNGPTGFGPNLPFYDSKFVGKVLAVATALRDDDLSNGHGKNILGFANGCGVARNWCLVAPGLNLISPLRDGNPDTGFVGPDNTATGSSAEPPRSNTSLATAVASGALAVLRSANQSTPMSVLMAVLLTSADKTITNDSGATVTTFTGVDDVYGHGYLNLGAAITSVSNIDIDLSGPTITIDRYNPETNPNSANTDDDNRYQQFARLVNARPAYSDGWQGQGVTVGVLDSGFSFSSNSIKENLLGTGRKADADGNLSAPDQTDLASATFQGSAAAAVLAGSNTNSDTGGLNYHGVAPLVKILPLQAGSTSGGLYAGLTGDRSALVGYALTLNSGDPGVQILNFSAYGDGGSAAAPPSGGVRSVQTAPAVITVRHNGNDVLWQVARTKQYYDLVGGSEAVTAASEANALAALVDTSDDVVFVYPTGKHSFSGADCIRVGGSCLQESGSDVTWDDFKGSFTRKADGTEDVFQVEDLFPNGPSGPSGFGPNLPFYDSKFVGKVLAVASAVRDHNLDDGHGKNILSFANGCGVARNWCLVAPDFNLISPVFGGSLDSRFVGPDNTATGSSAEAARSNTSLATAVASGALAVLRSANQGMPMSVLMAVLLSTADKTITSATGATLTTFTGVDDVYGHGYLNLGAAITSVANINIDLDPPSIVIERYSPETNPNSSNADDDDRYQQFARLVSGRPAYLLGAQGQRVTVGVVDSGFNFSSNSIKDNLLGTGRKAAADGSLSTPDQTDPASGTFQGNAAAAVLAGANTDSDTGGLHYHGVAPQAKILPLQAGSQSSGVYAGLTGDQSALVGYALTVNSGDPGVQILNFSAYGDGGPAAATPSGGVRSVHTNPATITVRHNGANVLWQVARTKQYYDLELVPSSEAAAAASEASALAALVDASDDVVFVYPTGKHSFNGANCIRVGGSCLQDSNSNDVTWNDFKDSIIRDADGINVTKVETLFPNGMNGPSGFGPNLPFYDDKFVGKVLAVASAVRDDDLSGAHGKNILGFANGCGVAKNWCLVAPGLNRISPLTGSSSLDTGFVGPDNTATGSSAEAVRSNTSLATAVASGALAVLRSTNRSTPMSVLMAVLLSTADKTIANVAGEPVTTFTGVDDVYGHGYLNLGAAIIAATNVDIDLDPPSIAIDRYLPETNPNSANTGSVDRYQLFSELVNARPSYSLGWQGQGVTVGVVDSGFNFASNSIKDNLLDTGKKAAADGTLSDPDQTDPAAYFQGNAAAAVLAGANTAADTGGVNYHGVAPLAKILPLQAGGVSINVANITAYIGLTGDQSALVGYALTVNGGDPGVQILNFSGYEDGGELAGVSFSGFRSVHTVPATITVRHGGADRLWQVARTKQYYDLDLVPSSEATAATSEASALAALVDADDDVVFVYPTGKHSFNGANCIRIGGSCLQDSNSNDVTWNDFKGSFIRDADGNNVSEVEDLFPNGGNGPSGFGPNLPLYNSKFEGKVLAVASAVRDEDLSNGHGKEINDFANGCGVAKNWCLVAPGLNQIATSVIFGTFNGPDNTATGAANGSTQSNTSLATAVASGALAVLRSANQSTPMSVLMAVLLTSADKTINDESGTQVTTFTGVDDVYGHGYLNLGAAITSVSNIDIDLSGPTITIDRYPNDDRYRLFTRLANGRTAYSDGWQGQGVTVGIIDSGFNFASNSIKDNLLATGKKAAADGTLSDPDTTDPHIRAYQGNMVAAVVAGSNTTAETGSVNYHGVAPRAKILPLQAGSEGTTFNLATYSGLSGNQNALVGYALTVSSGDPGVQILNFSSYNDAGVFWDQESLGFTGFRFSDQSVRTLPATITVEVRNTFTNTNDRKLWRVARTKQYYDFVGGQEATTAANAAAALAALVGADDDVVFVYPTGKHEFNSVFGANCIREGTSTSIRCLNVGGPDIKWEEFKDVYTIKSNRQDLQVKELLPNGMNGPSGFGPNLPLYDSKFVGKVLAVASAVRDDDLSNGHGKEISDFANGCGEAKHWCLVAPDYNTLRISTSPESTVVSGPDNTAFGSSRGASKTNTSLAAAVASGALAVLRSANQSVPMSVIMAVLLSSADKTITSATGATVTTFTGVDDVYGHGYLNLGAAITTSTDINIHLGPDYQPETNPNSANTNDDDRYQQFARLVNARPSYSLGWQGQGVTVGVVDSGFNFNSNSLKDNLLDTGKKAAADGTLSDPDTTDRARLFQGNAAAAVLAGANTDADTGGVNYHGVAPQAKILPLQAGSGSGNSYAGLTGDQSALVGYALTVNSGDPGVQILNFSSYDDGGTPARSAIFGLRSVQTEPATIRVFQPLPGGFGTIWQWQVARTKQYYDLVGGSEAEAATNQANALAALVDADDDVVFVYPTGKHSFNGAGCIRIAGSCAQSGGSNLVWDDFKKLFTRIGNANGPRVEELFPNGLNGPSGFGPNLPLYNTKFVGKVLAVASAVRDDDLSNGHGKNILGYANGCGVAKHWCLVAPGINRIDSFTNPVDGFIGPNNSADGSSNTASGSNTSLATAVVSGALAVLRSANPSTPMSVLMATLLKSADKTITDGTGTEVTTFTGVDDVYGHGYLNLGAAITAATNININLGQDYQPKTNPNSANTDDDDRYQQFARLVNALPSYSLGWQGQGVTVGVVDSGFNFASNSLKDNLLTTGKKAAADGTLSDPDQTDPAAYFQGNAAAAVLAGANTAADTGGVNYHGVAPLAKILPLQAGGVSINAANISEYIGLTGDQSALVGYALTVNGGDPGVQILNFSGYEDGGELAGVSFSGFRSVHTVPATITVRHGGADRLWQVARTKQYYDLVGGDEATAATSEASALAALVDADDDVVFVYPTGKHSFNGANCIRIGGSCLQDSNSNDVTWNDFKGSFIRDADGNNVSEVEDLFPNGGNGPSGFGPNLPLYNSKFEGKVLAVASAVRDEDLSNGHGKEINDFANGCGVAKNWCLVAPGLNQIAASLIFGTFNGPDNTATGAFNASAQSNTSLATAVVSGALAVLRSANRSTPMSVLMATLLKSADKTITDGAGTEVTKFTGTDDVYGHGYLNLGAAITTMAETEVSGNSLVSSAAKYTAAAATRKGPAALLIETKITLSPALRSLYHNAAGISVAARYLGKYYYEMPFSGLLDASAAGFDAGAGLAASGMLIDELDDTIPQGFSIHRSAAGDINSFGLRQGRAAFEYTLCKSCVSAPADRFDLSKSASPYFATAKRSIRGSWETSLGSLGGLSAFSEAGLDGENQFSGYTQHGLRWDSLDTLGNWRMTAELSGIREKSGMLLGSTTSGGLEIEGNRLRQLDLRVERRIGDWRLFGATEHGWGGETSVKELSLVTGVKGVRYQGWRLGLESSSRLRTGDHLLLGFTSHPRVTSGRADLRLTRMTGSKTHDADLAMDLNDEAVAYETSVDLSGSGASSLFLGYAAPLGGRGLRFGAGLEHVVGDSDVKTFRDETALSFMLKWDF